MTDQKKTTPAPTVALSDESKEILAAASDTAITINEPGVGLAALVPEAVVPLTLDEAIRAVLVALGVEEEDVKGFEVRANGVIRFAGTDNSGQSFRFTPLERKVIGQ